MKFRKIIASVLSLSVFLSSTSMSIVSFAAGKEGRMKNYKVHLKAATIENGIENPKRKTAEKNFNSKASKESSPYIISFTGPITGEMKKNVTKMGVKLLDYIPKYSFLSFMKSDIAEKIKEIECVAEVIPYLDEYKIDPELMEEINNSNDKGLEEEVNVAISTFDMDCSDVIKAVNKDGISEISEKGQLKKVKIKRKSVIDISKIKSVKFIEKQHEFELHNDVARGIMGFESSQNMSYEGEGQIVCVADTGLDKGNPGLKNSTIHSDFAGRVNKIIDKNGKDGSDSNGHGTHVSGSVLGNGQMSNGKIKGTAPKANLIMQDICPDASKSVYFNETLYELLDEAYNNGARIHTNSWGSATKGAYTSTSADVDRFMWDHKDMVVLFSAGNNGEDGGCTVGSPGTAKNCITVGASENFKPYMELSTSDNPGERANFSSYGCVDGRIKPDVVAPGSSILSTRSMLNSESNEYYTYMSGTSMSTPLTAGTVAVIREYLQKNKGIANPSSALIKALLINGSLDKGYTNEMGWGKVSVYDSLYSTKIIDQDSSLNTNESRTYESSCYVNDTDKPLKVTLVWTDYPGTSTSPNSLVNDLDLKIISPDGKVVYNGNDFTAPYDSEYDRINNVENVIIDYPEKGMYKIVVSGYNVSYGPQPYALVASYDFFSTPKNVKASPHLNSIKVSWDRVPGATGYDISVDGRIIELTDTSYTHRNLKQNTQHSYKVRAKSGNKIGDWSNEISVFTVLDTPILSGEVETNIINLKWQPIEEAEYYEIFFEGSLMAETTDTSYNLSIIEPKSTFNFLVRARTDTNSSLPSNNLTITTLDCGLNTKASMNEARMNFDSLASKNGKVYVFGGINDSQNYLNSVEEYDPKNNIWLRKESMSVERTGVAAVEASNGKIYVIGGYNGSYLNTVEEYDPSTGLWTVKAPMITPRSDLGAVYVDGKIYAIGGKNEKSLDTVEVYDPITDKWTEAEKMPTARSNFGITVKDGSVLVLGGVNGTTSLKTVEEYSPALNKWTVKKNLNKWNSDFSLSEIDGTLFLAGGKNSDKIEEYDVLTGLTTERITLPTSLYGHSSVVVDGKLLIIGGNNGSKCQNKVFCYDIFGGRWNKENDMNYQRSFFSSAVVNGKIYVFGGFGGQNYNLKKLNTVEEYDPSSDTWTLCPNMPAARICSSAAAVNDKIYVSGGSDNQSVDGVSEVYDTMYEYDTVNKTWTNKSKMPEKRFRHEAVELNGYIYIIGGQKLVNNKISLAEDILRYDPKNDKWDILGKMNIPRYNHSVGVANGKIYAFGGQVDIVTTIDSIEEYDPATNKWSVKNPMPYKDSQFGIFSLNNKIYVIGSSRENFLEYDPITETWVRKGSYAYNDAHRHKIVYLNNKIYALGGMSYYTIPIVLNTVYTSDDFVTAFTIGSDVMEPRSGKRSVPLTINNVPTDGIYRAEAEISYDPNKITVSNVTPGQTVPYGCNFTYNVDNSVGKVKITFTGNMQSQSLIKTNGVFADVEFDVSDNVNEIGSIPLTFEKDNCKIYKSPDFQYDGIKLNNGSIDIFVYGDVDGNSIVSMDDVQIIKDHILGLTSDLSYDQYGQLAADVDGNGLVNTIDVAYVIKFVQGKIDKFPIQQ